MELHDRIEQHTQKHMCVNTHSHATIALEPCPTASVLPLSHLLSYPRKPPWLISWALAFSCSRKELEAGVLRKILGSY